MHAILKRFDAPDEIRRFEKGTFERVTVGDMTIGRAPDEPGWQWSEHLGRAPLERMLGNPRQSRAHQRPTL